MKINKTEPNRIEPNQAEKRKGKKGRCKLNAMTASFKGLLVQVDSVKVRGYN